MIKMGRDGIASDILWLLGMGRGADSLPPTIRVRPVKPMTHYKTRVGISKTRLLLRAYYHYRDELTYSSAIVNPNKHNIVRSVPC